MASTIKITLKCFILLGLALVFSCNNQNLRKETSKTEEPASVKKMTPGEYVNHYNEENSILIDCRTPEEYNEGTIKGALNVDYRNGEFEQKIPAMEKDKTYYLFCASGNRSSKAAKLLIDSGFKNIIEMGGYSGLKEAGLPTTER